MQFADRADAGRALARVVAELHLADVVVLTDGPLPSGFHAPEGWRTLPGSALVHDGAMRLSLVTTAFWAAGKYWLCCLFT